ncbi:Transcriptional activator protein LasR [compost metagenome]|uniref:LuxR family transcriptional regulator n=1 Tax=Pseudomonas putida TaxID=303 RepID=UPI000FC24D2A|nr:LuxR family transcriptional regulator [Pseudomonas putida]
MNVIEQFRALTATTTLDEWFDTLKRLAGDLGYGQILLGMKWKAQADHREAFIRSNYPQLWRQRYDREDFALVDPVVAHCMRSPLPFSWSGYSSHVKGTRQFFEEAASQGLQHGVALPLHGGQGQSGMLSLVWQGGGGKDYERHLEATLGSATLLRDFAMESIIVLLTPSHWPNTPLTQRELEVLVWSAAGKTTWEISMILSCSASTIDFHFKNIRRKFNVSSRQLAVVKALQSRLINP